MSVCPLKTSGGLRVAGRRFWAAVADQLVLNPGEIALLEQAARTADELDRLERAVRALPELTTTGSTGQIRPHPLLAEVRALGERRLLRCPIGRRTSSSLFLTSL
jgi:hypothetical protein